MWRDPLDELIEDLERVVPAQTAVPRQRLPRLEDFQEVISAILFKTDEELERWRADPRHRQLEETVHRQCAESLRGHQRNESTQRDQTGPPTSRDSIEATCIQLRNPLRT